MMKYKGYIGQVTYDNEARLFHGSVVGLKDIITFQGRNVDELEKAFHDSIDDYINWCKERGEEPEKAFSGNLRIRLSSSLHAKLSHEAQSRKLSLNSFIIQKLENKIFLLRFYFSVTFSWISIPITCAKNQLI